MSETGFGALGDVPGPTDEKSGVTELDIFGGTEIDTSLLSRTDVILYPAGGGSLDIRNNTGPIRFELITDGERYWDMKSVRLWGGIKIVTAAGGNLPAAALVATCNMPGQSMFEGVRIDVNGQPISTFSQSHNGYKAHIETLISYGPNAARTHLKLGLFAQDTAGQMDTMVLHTPSRHYRPAAGDLPLLAGRESNAINKGWERRRQWFAESKLVQFSQTLHSDFFHTERYLPPGINIGLTFERAHDEFVLMYPGLAQNQYKIQIQNLELHITKIEINPSLARAHRKLMPFNNCRYFYTASNIKQFTIPRGMVQHTQPNFLRGILPNQLVIGLVEDLAFNGQNDKNPFNFQHYHMEEFKLIIEGVQFPARPYVMNFDYALTHGNTANARVIRDFYDNCPMGIMLIFNLCLCGRERGYIYYIYMCIFFRNCRL